MTIPNRISQDGQDLKEVLLEFLASASSLADLMNTTMTAVLNEIMSIQADEACGAGYRQRSQARSNSRNGYRPRRLDTGIGTLDLAVPKLRSGSFFPSGLFARGTKIDQALASAVAEMYVTGTSTRKVEKIARRLGVESLSKDQVSRLNGVIDAEVDAFLARDWSDTAFAYLFLDATYVKARVGGRVRKQAFLTAIGVGADGRRHFLSFACASAETRMSWLGFLSDLASRGVVGVRLVVSDAHEGLARAIGEVYPEAAWQRCIAHLKRNALEAAGGKAAQERARAVMAPVFAHGEPDLTRALYHRAIDELEAFAPAAARVLEEAETEALAYLAFPVEHRTRIRTNNVSERQNREIKRRVRVVGAFPSTDSVMRLLGGLVEEFNRDWAASRVFIAPESLARVLAPDYEPEPARTDIAPETAAAAATIVNLALAEYDKAA